MRTPVSTGSSWQYSFLRPAQVDAFDYAVYDHFHGGPMFVAVALGRLDLDRLLAAHRDRLWRAAQMDRPGPRGGWRTEHRQLLFKLEPDVWAHADADSSGVRVFARDLGAAERTARELMDRFRARRRRPMPSFHLLSMVGGVVDTNQVDLCGPVCRTPAELGLLYGEDFPAWEQSFLEALRAPRPGAAILRGPPGTGKTSFLRHVMGRLRGSHRFYVLPASDLELLTSPRLVTFWTEEGACYPDTMKAVVLEDAEELLADRGEGDRSAVASLLNIADGLMGDFLQMKLVCTANCALERLDPAVTRSGRLLACREFARVPRDRAERIAAAHGLALEPQADYSLAEVFAGPPKTDAADARTIRGFAP